MGFLDLFNSQSTTPTVHSVLPEAARQQILRGQLPTLELDSLFLRNGEICHFADRAVYKNVLLSKGEFIRTLVTVCLDYSKAHEIMLVVVIQNTLMM